MLAQLMPGQATLEPWGARCDGFCLLFYVGSGEGSSSFGLFSIGFGAGFWRRKKRKRRRRRAWMEQFGGAIDFFF